MQKKPLQWTALQNHIEKWFYKPDLEALEVVLSAAAAHGAIKGDPIWLFVQGPSGSGKGEIIVNSLRAIPPYTKVMGALNRNSLISFNRGQPGGELLGIPKVNNEHSGLLVFKDFTTLLSLREEERTEVVAQFREVYDGQWTRSTGSGSVTWNGKVTCIAACTPVLEHAWSLKRDLGERFLTVRWSRVGGINLAKMAGKQRGYETIIRTTTTELAQQFVANSKIHALPDLPEDIFEKIGNLAEFVAVLRANVHRNPTGKREISSEPVPEEPGRIHKSLAALASSHSALFQQKLGEDDYRISKRVALNSIPSNRFHLLNKLPSETEWVNVSTWAKASRVSPSSLQWNADEMVALGALESNEEKEIKEYRLSEKFQNLIKNAGLKLPF